MTKATGDNKKNKFYRPQFVEIDSAALLELLIGKKLST